MRRGGGSLYHPKYRDAGGAVRESPTWWARYRQNGREVRESTGARAVEQARRFLHTRLGAVARGERVQPKADRVTFAEMAEHLRRDYRTNGKDLPTLEARLAHLLPAFGPHRMARLIMADVERYKDARLAAVVVDGEETTPGASAGTVNRELEVLARAFTLGRDLGVLTATLRVRRARLAEAAPRAGFFEREQFEAVRRELAAGARPRTRRGNAERGRRYARPDLVLAVTLYHEYGWRLREVLDLDVRHLTLAEGDHGVVRLDAGSTKNGDGRVVFLTPEVRRMVDEQVARVAALSKQLGRVVPHLFPHLTGRRRGERVRDFPRAWRSACQRAGCSGMLRHDFRRTAARNMVNAGVPERTAMTVTGHRTRSMFDRYNIVSPAEKQEAARRIAAASEEAARRVAASAPVVVPLLPRRASALA